VDRSLHTIADPLRLAASFPQALVRLLRWRPDAIYTTGGYVAIPVLAAAALLRIPALLWEGNRTPGRSVRLVARLATVRAVSFAATRERLPAPSYLTGTPIREASPRDRASARGRLGLPADVPVMLIFGGSQSVRRMSEAVADAVPDLVTRCAVLHITGDAFFADAEALRSRLPADRRARYLPVAFLHEGMGDAMAAADLVVGRAGSSTLAEVAAAGLPMIVVPYPHAAAHQVANAAEMVESGAAIHVPDERFDGDTLRMAAAMLDDGERLAAMREATTGLGRPGAAAATAELLLALAARRPLPDPRAVEARSREAP
jgi:UDP-N-acetylglucosamine--N-acetylmuramyl-(pentapeptide) pyrophosphoryl-undecaprenol N-acetylglucosamine transferase